MTKNDNRLQLVVCNEILIHHQLLPQKKDLSLKSHKSLVRKNTDLIDYLETIVSFRNSKGTPSF
jgi:hypothetical protein